MSKKTYAREISKIPQCNCSECPKKRRSLQRSSFSNAKLASIPPIVHDVLKSPGQPIDTDIRSFMELNLGHEFRKVRIHADSRAAESAQAVNALAYTVGQKVIFGKGQYSPETQAGRRLIGHELIHVVQQRGQSYSPDSVIGISSVADPAEKEAERISQTMDSKISSHITQNKLHRQSKADEFAANQATTVPVQPAAAPPATNMSDPNSLIPIADFIRYVEAVEKGYPNDRPSDTVTRIIQK